MSTPSDWGGRFQEEVQRQKGSLDAADMRQAKKRIEGEIWVREMTPVARRAVAEYQSAGIRGQKAQMPGIFSPRVWLIAGPGDPKIYASSDGKLYMGRQYSPGRRPAVDRIRGGDSRSHAYLNVTPERVMETVAREIAVHQRRRRK